jgi:hypothetical protein
VIVLDTNVLSALMRADDEPQVRVWLDRQPGESLWTTSITIFEIRFGLALLTRGRRRDRLYSDLDFAMNQVLGGRVLGFDELAAKAAADFASERRRNGRPVEIRDAQIAGIVTARKATLATRNARDFAGVGISLVNPWRD